MTMGAGDRFGGGRAGGRISARDAEAQRALNALAPTIPDLLPRIARLFAPHRTALIGTGLLVLVGAGLTVISPLLTREAFDAGLFPRMAAPTSRCCWR